MANEWPTFLLKEISMPDLNLGKVAKPTDLIREARLYITSRPKEFPTIDDKKWPPWEHKDELIDLLIREESISRMIFQVMDEILQGTKKWSIPNFERYIHCQCEALYEVRLGISELI
jgi:hypothetical protein